jgi:hypothetical protein
MNLIFHDVLGVLVELYIDGVVVKLAGFDGHLANLHVAFDKMRRYGLKMKTLKCALGVSARRFLGFIESVNKLTDPTCKKDVHKLLGKVNYLRRFIANLAGKVESFLPLVRLKHNDEFTWGSRPKKSIRADQGIPIKCTGSQGAKGGRSVQTVHRRSVQRDRSNADASGRQEGIHDRLHKQMLAGC